MQDIIIYLTNAEGYSTIRLRNDSTINNRLIRNIDNNDLINLLKEPFISCISTSAEAVETKFIVNTNTIAKISYK